MSPSLAKEPALPHQEDLHITVTGGLITLTTVFEGGLNLVEEINTDGSGHTYIIDLLGNRFIANLEEIYPLETHE